MTTSSLPFHNQDDIFLHDVDFKEINKLCMLPFLDHGDLPFQDFQRFVVVFYELGRVKFLVLVIETMAFLDHGEGSPEKRQSKIGWLSN